MKETDFYDRKSGGFGDKLYLAGKGEEERETRNSLRRRSLEEGRIW